MMENMPGLRVVVSRLPRMLTDQTASALDADSADPIDVLLPLIRATHAA